METKMLTRKEIEQASLSQLEAWLDLCPMTDPPAGEAEFRDWQAKRDQAVALGLMEPDMDVDGPYLTLTGLWGLVYERYYPEETDD